MKEIEIAIIGAGPAGIAAGLQLKRYGHEAVIFERDKVGGLLHNANRVENYLGFPSGISGRAMVNKIKHHAEASGLQIKIEEVQNLDHNGSEFIIRTGSDTYSAPIAIVASGTKPIRDENINLPEPIKDSVLYEIDSILNVKSKKIGIIGAGDAAFDYALNLGQHNEVYIYNRSDQRKCLPLLYERVMASPNIAYYEKARINSLDKSDSSRIAVKLTSHTKAIEIELDYLVIAIGRRPNLDFLSGEVNKNRYALEKTGTLHFIGDVANGSFRQAAIAAGDGIKAAMMIQASLKEKIK